MWRYSQSSGVLTGPAGTKIAQGYSGNGNGLNNPELQHIHDVGPLPQGLYSIGALQATHDKLGTNVLPLTAAASNEMFGRDSFYLHGDNHKMDYSASEGCVILPLWARMQIADSEDRELEVTA